MLNLLYLLFQLLEHTHVKVKSNVCKLKLQNYQLFLKILHFFSEKVNRQKMLNKVKPSIEKVNVKPVSASFLLKKLNVKVHVINNFSIQCFY